LVLHPSTVMRYKMPWTSDFVLRGLQEGVFPTKSRPITTGLVTNLVYADKIRDSH
jgi:hypothetical protein